jgi:hypothetical protein
MEILRIAYARSWSVNGFKYFIIRGPIAWFLLICLCLSIHAILKEATFLPDRLFLNLVVAIVSGIVIGVIVFPIIRWQSIKWDRSLTDGEEKKVIEQMKDLHPFRIIYLFIIVFSVFNTVVRLLFGIVK